MKRIIFCLAAALALFSCSKGKAVDPAAPTISWGANSSFALQEMGDNMDGIITVSCTSGIASLQIKCIEMPDLCKLRVSSWISTQAYKSSYTLDLLADPTLAEVFSANNIANPVGRNLIKASSCTLDFKALLDALVKDLALKNGDRFSFGIYVSNTAGTMINKLATFRWTAAATFPDNVPSTYYLRKDDTNKLELSITVPGKVDKLTISFEGEQADEGILAYVRKKSAGKGTVIDLVNDTNLETAFHMQKVEKNAAMATLKLSGLMQDLGYECGPDTVTDMVITVTDALGKMSSHTIALIPATAE